MSATAIVFLANVVVSDNVRETDHGKQNVGHVVEFLDRNDNVIVERIYLNTQSISDAKVKGITEVYGVDLDFTTNEAGVTTLTK